MRRERVLPCAISGFRRLRARMRTAATEDEPLDRVGEAVVAIAVRHEIRFSLHLRTGITHGDAETSSLEHRDIVAAVTNGGDFCQRNSQQLRDFRQCRTLIGERVGDVEVVELRTYDEGAVAERGPYILLAMFENIEILADADDLCSGLKGRAKTLNDRRRHPYRVLIKRNIRPAGVAHEPVPPAE